MTCDVCGRPSVHVASSALGAISFAYCRVCAVNGAEPRGMLAAMVLEMMSGPPPFTPEVETANWLLDDVTTLIDGEYVVARDALKLPTDSDIARYLDDGCPTDLNGWAYEVITAQRAQIDRANQEHCGGVPHSDCTCSCSCCLNVCSPVDAQGDFWAKLDAASKPSQEGADAT